MGEMKSVILTSLLVLGCNRHSSEPTAVEVPKRQEEAACEATNGEGLTVVHTDSPAKLQTSSLSAILESDDSELLFLNFTYLDMRLALEGHQGLPRGGHVRLSGGGGTVKLEPSTLEVLIHEKHSLKPKYDCDIKRLSEFAKKHKSADLFLLVEE